ncbi:MAG: hypothetical protein ABIA37_05215 [Candidatus Woesearchaeota archaeon]
MPKKKLPKKSELKKKLKQFLEGSLIILAGFISKINPVEWIKSIIHLKKNIRRYLVFLVLLIAGIVVFTLGLAAYIKYIFPILKNGLSEMLIGIILILISFIVYKIKRR